MGMQELYIIIDPETSNKIICPDCEKSFASYSKLWQHVNDDHQIAFREPKLVVSKKKKKKINNWLYNFMIWKEIEEKLLYMVPNQQVSILHY